MQAIYYPVSRISVDSKEHFLLRTFHDEYSLWFDVSKTEKYFYALVYLVFLQLTLFLFHLLYDINSQLFLMALFKISKLRLFFLVVDFN